VDFSVKKVLVCFFAVFVLGPGSPSAARAGDDCSQLIVGRCEACHYTTRICEKLGLKSRSSWKRTVNNMVRYGAKLTADEMKQVVRCLSEPADDIARLCRK